MKQLQFLILVLLFAACGDDDTPSFDRDFLVDNVDGNYVLFSVSAVENQDEVPLGVFDNGSLLETLNCTGGAMIMFDNGEFSVQSGPFNTSGVTSPECSGEENSNLIETGEFFVQEDDANIGLTGSNPIYLIFFQDVQIILMDEDFQNRKSLKFSIVGENPDTEIEFRLNYIFLQE